jgi:hypothetical protein
MKKYGVFAQDGFKASIEAYRFKRDLHYDIIDAITSLIGADPVFIKGGEITEAGGSTTIANGIVSYNGGMYTFTGGTYAGTPATLKVLFATGTAAGYPKPYFVGDPVPKDIYLANTARIDTAGSLALGVVGRISNIKTITDGIAPLITYSHITIGAKAPFNGSLYLYRIGRTVTIYGYAAYDGPATTQGLTMFENIPAAYNPADIDITLLARAIPIGITQGYNVGTNMFDNPIVGYMLLGINSLGLQSSIPNGTTQAAIINIHPITYIANN